MRPNSPKRAAQMRIYAKRRPIFLAANPQCSWPLGCGEASTEVHHRRGRVGGLLLDERYWSAICRTHHERATLHPREAYELGISERRVGRSA